MLKKYIPKPGRREYVTFLPLILEIILFGIFAPGFLTVDNLIRVIQNNAEIAMVSIGMTIVMLLGGIDLSVGSVMGVIAIVIGYMSQGEVNIFLILLVAIVIGIGVGFINGFLVAQFNIPDMIVTIATMNIWKRNDFCSSRREMADRTKSKLCADHKGESAGDSGITDFNYCSLCAVLLLPDVQKIWAVYLCDGL